MNIQGPGSLSCRGGKETQTKRQSCNVREVGTKAKPDHDSNHFADETMVIAREPGFVTLRTCGMPFTYWLISSFGDIKITPSEFGANFEYTLFVAHQY